MYKVVARFTFSDGTKSESFNWGKKYKSIRRALQAATSFKKIYPADRWGASVQSNNNGKVFCRLTDFFVEHYYRDLL